MLVSTASRDEHAFALGEGETVAWLGEGRLVGDGLVCSSKCHKKGGTELMRTRGRLHSL